MLHCHFGNPAGCGCDEAFGLKEIALDTLRERRLALNGEEDELLDCLDWLEIGGRKLYPHQRMQTIRTRHCLKDAEPVQCSLLG